MAEPAPCQQDAGHSIEMLSETLAPRMATSSDHQVAPTPSVEDAEHTEASTNGTETVITVEETKTSTSNPTGVLATADNANSTEQADEKRGVSDHTIVGQLCEPSPNPLQSLMQNQSEPLDLIHYSSDEDDHDAPSDDSSSSSETDNSSEESDSSSSDDDDADVQDKTGGKTALMDDEDEGGNNEEPIVSKNEVLDEQAMTLPEDFSISDKAPLELIGEVTSAVERNVIVKAYVSGEFRILKEGSILCFEDKQVLGPLFEVFGRLQAPFYRIKFNSETQFMRYREKIGAKVFYVVPDSQFIYTDEIKAIKGTDASNWNDEEVPEEEQEFSDDEKEAASKSKRKKNKKTNNKIIDNKRKASDDSVVKKVHQYKPIYGSYQSVNEKEGSSKTEAVPLKQSIIDPQEQMRKLQEQFMQIHNANLASRQASSTPSATQFVPPPNMVRAVPHYQTNTHTQMSHFQQQLTGNQQPLYSQQYAQNFQQMNQYPNVAASQFIQGGYLTQQQYPLYQQPFVPPPASYNNHTPTNQGYIPPNPSKKRLGSSNHQEEFADQAPKEDEFDY